MSFRYPRHKNSRKPNPEEPNFHLGYKMRHEGQRVPGPSSTIKNPMFNAASEPLKMDLEMLPMKKPVDGRGKTFRRTEKISVVTECELGFKDDANGRRDSTRVSRFLVVFMALMFLMCSGTVVMTILLYLGKVGPTAGCMCGDGRKSKPPSTTALPTQSWPTKVKELEAALIVQNGTITEHGDRIKFLTEELKQMARLVGLHVALNSTRQDVKELKQVWEAVNATKEDVKTNVWGALNKTEEKLVQLSSVWFVVNSTKEDVQQLKEMSHNLTTVTKARLSDVLNNITSAQQSCSILKLSLDTMSDKLNITRKKLRESHRILLDRVTSVNATLINQMEIISKTPGPGGPKGCNGSQGLNASQGSTGPPGPQGPGNWSGCLYKLAESTATGASNDAQEDISVTEPSDKRIVGATCSTDDAEEYRLSSKFASGRRMYTCTCAGQSQLMKSTSRMRCFLHYWECPM